MRKTRYPAPGEKLTKAETYFLTGPVKQLMEIVYQAHFDRGIVVQGKLEAESAYSDTNFIATFDQHGGYIKLQKYGANDCEEEFYNEKGLQVQTVKYQNGKLKSTVNIIYNDKGYLTDYITTDADGKESQRITNTHNEFGQMLETASYMGHDRRLLHKTIYTYHDKVLEANGNKYYPMLKSVAYKGDGTIEHTSSNKYNEQGKPTESIMEYTDEKMSKYNRHSTQKYNEQGDCIELTYYNRDGSVKDSHSFTHEYDSEGKKIITPREPFDPDALKPGETEETKKDHHGNWTKKTTFFQKKPINILYRQISYYGEASENQPDFVHPLSVAQPESIKKIEREPEELEPGIAKWLAEGTASSDAFPIHRYYALKYNDFPSLINFTSGNIEVFALLKLLQENTSARLVHSAGTIWNGWAERLTRYTLSFDFQPGYLLQVHSIGSADEDEYILPSHFSKLLNDSEHVHFGSVQLLRPSEGSGKRDDWFEDRLGEYIDDCALTRQPEKPYINIIEVSGNNFAMVEHPVDDDFEIRDLDINYGYGFKKFHEDLMHRFNSSTKGLVLFHGEPGTGKTYYIRHLLRKMVANRKVVIYMPPNMVDHLVEPGFMTFLMHEVRNWSAEGNFCVLLIEDAEPLLAKRQEGVRIQGVTNLLNLSDGLLNDMLNLQIICTFNVDLKKLDSALLRPGRLIARKEFKPLGELDANLLAQRLGIKHHFTKPVTLSEIYAMRKNQNTLIHDVEPDKDASTILDDL